MNSPANHAAGDRLLARLNAALREQWNYGSDALVGWRSCEDSVAYLYAPALKIFSSVKAHHRIVHGERGMGVRTFADIAKLLLAEPRHFSFHQAAASPTKIESIFVRYTITHTRNLAAFLHNIAGFSLFTRKNRRHN